MKKRSKKPLTKSAAKKALSASGLTPTKITVGKTIPVSKSYIARQRREKERRRAKLQTVPKKYKSALAKFGLARADAIVKRRGTYYAGAGQFEIQKNKLKVINSGVEVNDKIYTWRNATRKGWYIVSESGVVRPRLVRWSQVDREQKAAFRREKIRVVSEKTGLSKKSVREIISHIRRQEATKLRRFKKTKKFHSLSAAAKKKNTIQNRVTAIFGALCDFLEVYGSPKTQKE